MLTETLHSFGYPETLVKEYEHWFLICGPRQVTLGTLILVCKEGVETLAGVSDAAWHEFPVAIREIESALAQLFKNDRINYLFLMMANREAHAAIIPRYASERTFGGARFTDPGWPKGPDTNFFNELEPALFTTLVETLKGAFPKQ